MGCQLMMALIVAVLYMLTPNLVKSGKIKQIRKFYVLQECHILPSQKIHTRISTDNVAYLINRFAYIQPLIIYRLDNRSKCQIEL